MSTEVDSAWKDILDTHFESFLRFFFPEIHRDIDWSRGYETLDKELQVILRGSRSRKRLADKLVKVHLKSGRPVVILLHVEVQKRPEADFECRMFQYHYRIFDRRGGEVVSLAVLTDSRARPRRDCYLRRRWSFELLMRYPVVHLLDFEDRRSKLEASRNPFAVVVLAHLEARKARGKPAQAFVARWRLTRRLYERGYRKRDIMGLYKFMDWILRLPRGLERELQDRQRSLEGKTSMPYVSSIERFAKAEGKKEGKVEGKAEGKKEGLAEGEAKGLREAIALGLKLRFGPAGLKLLPRLREVEDLKALRRLLSAVQSAKNLEAFREKLPGA
jgi:hypothetical protein